jgi:AraC-like DNA-binding protein
MLVITRNCVTILLFAALMMLTYNSAFAQLTIRIVKVPKNTPASDSIFISSSFNNWNTKDIGIRLKPEGSGVYSVTFDPTVKYFEYKFTRGSWSAVEGDKKGNTITNRIFTYNGKPTTLEASIESWVDLEMIRIRVEGIPSNTPDDAALYITGPFNQWNPSDPNYKMEKVEKGTYQFVLPKRDSIAFKFTRGSFSSLESDDNGESIPARILVPSKLDLKTVNYTINGWEDLSESTGDGFEGALMITSFMGFFCCAALLFVRKAKQETNNILMIMLIVISVMLIVRILLNHQLFFYQTPKLVMFPLLLLFAVSPLMNIYTKSILHCYDQLSTKEYIIFFAPLVILIIGLLPLLIADKDHLVTLLLNHQIDNNFRVVGGVGVIYNIYYLYSAFSVLRKTNRVEGFVQRTYNVYIISLLAIGSLITSILIVIFVLSFFLEPSHRSVLEGGVNICWLLLCFYPIVVMWFLVTRQELFSTHHDRSKLKSKESLSNLKIKLDELMDSKKPFLDSELSLNDLSKMLHTDPHAISRLINEDDAINFYDFINGYRIQEFKNRCEQGQHKTMTIIAIANDVGFKSKTTFNRTFKKINGITPRDYLNTLKS